MNEIKFAIEEAREGGYTARALGESIFTEGEDLDNLCANIRDAVDCHFEPDQKPNLISLHTLRRA
jgi:predicted RNase H-like HicB family nuclease